MNNFQKKHKINKRFRKDYRKSLKDKLYRCKWNNEIQMGICELINKYRYLEHQYEERHRAGLSVESLKEEFTEYTEALNREIKCMHVILKDKFKYKIRNEKLDEYKIKEDEIDEMVEEYLGFVILYARVREKDHMKKFYIGKDLVFIKMKCRNY